MSRVDSPNSLPSKKIEPASGGMMFRIILMVVVLPAPFGPSSPSIWPRSTSSDTSSTARTAIYDFLTRTTFSMEPPSGREPVDHPRKGDRLPDVIEAADPRHGPFHSEAETRMRHRPVPSQIEVPFKGGLG